MTAAIWAAVMLIGGVGSVLRFVVDRSVAGRVARSFPLGTLVVNLSGAVLLGVLSGVALSHTAALLAGTAHRFIHHVFHLDAGDPAAH
jgi:CrcB protein